MTRDEYFQFMRETATIHIDMDTGFAYVPINSFKAGDRGAVESIELEKLVNATIELCRQSVMNSLGDAGNDICENLRCVFEGLPVK
jgi:capsule polysaccharide export protein KpsE/RkpR